MSLEIERIETVDFTYDLADVGTGPDGLHMGYEPGATAEIPVRAIRIEADSGAVGEYVGARPVMYPQIDRFASYLVGKDPLRREAHWNTMKHAYRQFDRTGMGPVDIALWDLAGRHHDAPIHALLGTYRDRLPAYASTLPGDEHGGLTTPEDYADFAAECRDHGYPAFKIHPPGWQGGMPDVDREVALVRAVGERVGDEMDLMHDPACRYETFGDALRVGRELDAQGYYWYEDPYLDGGFSQHAHRKLASKLDTPLLMTEHVRGLEAHTDFAATDATDFLRADPELDGGITGAVKIARVAEGFGIDVEYHLPGPAARQLLAATRNSNYYELGLVHPETRSRYPPVYADDYSDELDAVDPDGTVPVPGGPGLGVEYDWGFVEDNAVSSQTFD